MFKKKVEDKINESIEEIIQTNCPILNRGDEVLGLEVIIKFVDFEPYQIICPAYRKNKIDKDIDEHYDNFNCDLKKSDEDQSCIYNRWKRL